jgi:hypothetical protein
MVFGLLGSICPMRADGSNTAAAAKIARRIRFEFIVKLLVPASFD